MSNWDWNKFVGGVEKYRKKAASQFKDMVMTDIENKTRAATADTTYGCSATELGEIAVATFHRDDYPLIMGIIYQRLASTRWRCVYKALELLRYLLMHGSQRCYQDGRDALYHIRALQKYVSVEKGTGKDNGVSVRTKASVLVQMFEDDQYLQEEKEKSNQMRAKLGLPDISGFQNNSFYNNSQGPGIGSSGGGDGPGYGGGYGGEYGSGYGDGPGSVLGGGISSTQYTNASIYSASGPTVSSFGTNPYQVSLEQQQQRNQQQQPYAVEEEEHAQDQPQNANVDDLLGFNDPEPSAAPGTNKFLPLTDFNHMSTESNPHDDAPFEFDPRQWDNAEVHDQSQQTNTSSNTSAFQDILSNYDTNDNENLNDNNATTDAQFTGFRSNNLLANEVAAGLNSNDWGSFYDTAKQNLQKTDQSFGDFVTADGTDDNNTFHGFDSTSLSNTNNVSNVAPLQAAAAADLGKANTDDLFGGLVNFNALSLGIDKAQSRPIDKSKAMNSTLSSESTNQIPSEWQ